MHITFCGVRGSTRAPGAEYARYGGNTSCVAIAHCAGAAPTLLLDAGNGHWDHSLGLLARVMSPPFFPITPAGLRGAWTFGTIEPGLLRAEGFSVEAREIPHKGGRTFGYRVSDGRGVLAYITDHCPTAYGAGPDGLGPYHRDAVALAERADVVVHDAQLVAEEVPAEADWGHAAAEYAVRLGVRAGARRVVLFHHKPSRTDLELDAVGRRFAAAPVPVEVAAEGMTITL